MEWLWTKLSGQIFSYQAVCTAYFQHGEGHVQGGCSWGGPLRLVSSESVRESVERIALSDGIYHSNNTLTLVTGDIECPGTDAKVGHATRIQVTRRK